MSKEETITMKEHIEILCKQQDYQFAEGFKQGIKEEQLNILKIIDEVFKRYHIVDGKLFSPERVRKLINDIEQELKSRIEQK